MPDVQERTQEMDTGTDDDESDGGEDLDDLLAAEREAAAQDTLPNGASSRGAAAVEELPVLDIAPEEAWPEEDVQASRPTALQASTAAMPVASDAEPTAAVKKKLSKLQKKRAQADKEAAIRQRVRSCPGCPTRHRCRRKPDCSGIALPGSNSILNQSLTVSLRHLDTWHIYVAQELAEMDGDEAPETADEFERLLVAQPNVSFVWVKYMAFLISLGDIPAARAVVERALKIINYRYISVLLCLQPASALPIQYM